MRAIVLVAAAVACGPFDDERWCARHPEDCDDVTPTDGTDTDTVTTATVDGCGGPPEAQAACLVITEHCYECHGQGGRAEGGFNYALDVPRMLATGKVVPGDPPGSRIYSRSAGETMPPGSVKVRPAEADIDAIEAWIQAGAPDWDPDDDCAVRDFVDPTDEVGAVIGDLYTLDVPTQRNTRYLTLAHLWNSCVGADELQTYRYGLSKLLNSLSYGAAPVLPRAIDEHELIYAVDLRDLGWDDININGVNAWEHLVKRLPFGLSRDGSDVARDLTHSRFPIVPADWVVREASRPPLYNEILRLPDTGDAFLLDRFQVDRLANLASGEVLRAGFESSGVSDNNRMVERHKSADGGYCWVSYDFSTDVEAGNILSHPLHPLDPVGACTDAFSHMFQHAGGELICSLPNGLQAYYLETDLGVPIDTGPIEIVQDFDGPEAPFVMNGVSCMYCHAQGIIEKADGVSDHWAANVGDPDFAGLFPTCVDDMVQDRYREADALQQMIADRESFLSALEAVGVPREQQSEPVDILSGVYDEDMTPARVAAEFGLDHRFDSDASPSDLRGCLDALQAFDPTLALELTPLLSDNTVSREVFLGVASEFLCACDAIVPTLQVDDFVCHGTPAYPLAAAGVPRVNYTDESCGPAGISCLADQHCITFDADPKDRIDDVGACVDDVL